MTMSALTPKDRFDLARMGEMHRRLGRIEARDTEITEASTRAAELTRDPEKLKALLLLSDEELHASGWNREELHVALDANLPWPQMPGYMRMSHERNSLRLKARAERPEGGTSAREFITPGVRSPALPPVEDDE